MEAVIFSGIPGAGKSTFYRQRFGETHVRLSLDMLRTRNRERALMEACLATGQRFVIDNTNIFVEERKRYIDAAKAADFRVIGYFVESELKAAIARNHKRPPGQKIPVPGLIAKYKRLQPMAIEEGYDELYRVRLSVDNVFEVVPY